MRQLDELGYKTHKTAFAKHIKDILVEYYNWNGEKTEKFRTLLQELGTDTIRKKLNKPFFHCQRTMENIESVQGDFDYFFIPDARFPNECYFAKSYFPDKVVHIKINRTNFSSPLTKEQRNHSSEVSMNNFTEYDYILNSESGLDNLEKEIKKQNILKELLNG